MLRPAPAIMNGRCRASSCSLTSRANVAPLDLGGVRCAHKKALVAFDHKGFRCMKPGDTYFHAFGTIIGSESLTTVFEMGTGVTFLI